MSEKTVSLEIFPVDYEGVSRRERLKAEARAYKTRQKRQAKIKFYAALLSWSVLVGACGFCIAVLLK